MLYLIITSLLWSFSFGLIKSEVSALHPILVSLIRLSLAFLFFLPWLKKGEKRRYQKLLLIGFIQFGMMYCLYISAYSYLSGHEIAVLTVTTPIFVVLLSKVIERNTQAKDWLAAILGLLGGIALVWPKILQENLAPTVTGIVLIQLANLCFATGQILYRHWSKDKKQGDHQSFAWLYLGAMFAPLSYLMVGQIIELPMMSRELNLPTEINTWLALLYLGIIPSGLGFYLWNKGSKLVKTGELAVVNNLKIPMAVLVAWLIFSEDIIWPATLTSLGILSFGQWLASRGTLETAA